MKTFKEFMQESSLSRIKSKSDKSGIATMSADRGNLSRKQNQARAKQLQKDIRGKFGRGPTKLKGSYDETDEKTGESRKVKEKSFAIDRGKMGKRKFKKEVKKLGKKYGQDSVIVQTKGGGDATLKRSRKGGLPKRNIKLGKMKPGGKSKEGETQVKGKTYTYEKDD